MKIVFIVDSLYSGGAGKVISLLSSQMTEYGYAAAVITVHDSRRLYKLSDRVDTEHIDFVSLNYFDRVKELRRLLKLLKPDVVISFLYNINVFSILASFFSKWKIIVSERNDPRSNPSKTAERLIRNLLYCFADRIVFQTTDAKDYFSGIIQKKGMIIGNPVSNSIPERYVGKRRKAIVAVGRLSQQKNYVMAINAFKRICEEFSEYVLEIYGEGEEREKLTKLIRDLGLSERVVLKGHIGNVLDKIKDASLYIMTSDYEGMSNALMEAMQLGLPVISTDHSGGGARTLIQDGYNGIISPVKDDEMFAKKIAMVLSDEKLREKISYNAYNINYTFSVKNITDKWIRLIDSISK